MTLKLQIYLTSLHSNVQEITSFKASHLLEVLGHHKMILCLANICFRNIHAGAFFVIKCPYACKFKVEKSLA